MHTFEKGDLVLYPVGDQFIQYIEEPELALVVGLEHPMVGRPWYFILQNGAVETVPCNMMQKVKSSPS